MNPNLLAFGIPQGPEMLFILILILLLFGAKKLPQLARGVGKSAGEFKKAKAEFENEIKSASDEAERAALQAERNTKDLKEDASPAITDSTEDADSSKQS